MFPPQLFDSYFSSKTSSIRKAIREKILSSSLHNLIQLTINIGNEKGTYFVQGNETNEILRSVINFQNSLMKELINCQSLRTNFSDVKLITKSGGSSVDDESNNNFPNTKFTVIEPVRMENGSLLRFYISKSALPGFPSALENYHIVNDGFEQLILPQVEVMCEFGAQTEKHVFEVFFTGVELISNVKNFALEKPVIRKFSDYLPIEIAEYSELLDQSLLFSLILVANNTGAKELLDLFCGQVALMIRGKSPEQIREAFNIKNDFTPEEEEQVRRENEWADG